ncbi:2959_t:CDS:2 [Scutellospora calospora]|uniref:2959_t:CDS:1 n=1 Tax=Scutellospora calospora TaxID=85575 RepID=A0ACA9LI76_9GLOM|nr:2959_t:CDS:2 [Scutellospora calospora]
MKHSELKNEKDDEKLSDEKLTNDELDKELNNEKLNDELPNIDDDNINLNRLNELEFVDISDNDIEDKIYNELKLEINKFFEKKSLYCSIKQLCFEKIGYNQFLKYRAEFESLDKKI